MIDNNDEDTDLLINDHNSVVVKMMQDNDTIAYQFKHKIYAENDRKYLIQTLNTEMSPWFKSDFKVLHLQVSCNTESIYLAFLRKGWLYTARISNHASLENYPQIVSLNAWDYEDFSDLFKHLKAKLLTRVSGRKGLRLKYKVFLTISIVAELVSITQFRLVIAKDQELLLMDHKYVPYLRIKSRKLCEVVRLLLNYGVLGKTSNFYIGSNGTKYTKLLISGIGRALSIYYREHFLGGVKPSVRYRKLYSLHTWYLADIIKYNFPDAVLDDPNKLLSSQEAVLNLPIDQYHYLAEL